MKQVIKVSEDLILEHDPDNPICFDVILISECRLILDRTEIGPLVEALKNLLV